MNPPASPLGRGSRQRTVFSAFRPWLLLVLALLFLVGPVGAATLNVPATYATIQAGINAAGNGDIVLVANGTYTGAGNVDLDFGGKNITVRSANGAAATIINCAGSSGNNHRGFFFHNGETAAAVVQGFTISNGYDTPGGAISIVGADNATGPSPTITQCVFLNNTAPSTGGAVFVNQAKPTITQCGFFGNAAGDATTSGFGGAIEIQTNDTAAAMAVAITNCVFDGNTATYDGGAIDITGLDATHPTVTVVNSSFTRNNANGFDDGSGYPTPAAGQIPGAVDLFFGALTITNSILYGDTYNSSTASEVSTLNTGTTTVDHSDVQGGFAGATNINANPLFVNAAGSDLRILYNSPAVNKGTTTGAPAIDYSGVTRDANPDMGAYEYAILVSTNLISAVQGDVFTGQVAMFNDTGGDTTPLGSLSAVIDWGDGSPTTAGSISGGSGSAYSVSGSHTYTAIGTFMLKVTITATPSNVTGSNIGSATVVGKPTANAQSVTTNQDIAKAITLTGSDPNTPPRSLTYTVTTSPTHGTLSGTAPNLTYTPTAGYFGADSFQFTVNNGTVTSSPATVSITVVGKPTANSQSVNVPFNTATAITLTGSDPNSPARSLTYTVTTSPTHGTLSGTAPNLTYTPTTGSHGADSFQFKVNNGALDSNTATVSLTVATGTPTANAQTVNVPFNTAAAITLTGSDPNSPPLSLTYTVTVSPAHGTLSGTAPNLTYTPTTGYHGADNFQFTVNNGTNSSSPATVTLNVATGTPTANNQSVTTGQDMAAAITLTGSDSDFPPLTLTYTVTVNPTHGTLSGTAPNLTYTPSAGYFGADSFQFTVNNGTNTSSPATVSITVVGKPTANAQSVNVTFNTATAITLTGSDPNTPPRSLTYTVTANPSHGTLSGAAPNLTYTPTMGYAGPDSFQFKVNDGILDSNTATVSITVNPGPVDHFVLSGTPPSVVAGTLFSVTVTAQDAFNNTATAYTGMVHFTSTDGQAVLPANTTLTNGTGTFSATLKTAGTQTVTATDTVTSSITGTSSNITVSPDVVATLSFAQPPASPQTQDAALTPAVTVEARDAYNNVVPSVPVAIVLAAAGTGVGTLSGTTPQMTDSSGIATFSDLVINQPGSYALEVSSNSQIVDSAAFTVNPAVVTDLAFTLQPTDTQAGQPINAALSPPAVVVRARDAVGSTVPGVTVTLSLSSGVGTLSGTASQTTDANGEATFTGLSVDLVGTKTLTAANSGGASQASAPFEITPAPATHLSVLAPASAVAGNAISVTVKALDAFGNTDTNYAGTVRLFSTDSQAVLPPDSTLITGVGQFTVTLKTAGGQTVTATDTVAASITGTSAAIAVSAAVSGNVAFVQQPTTTVAGATIAPAPTVKVTDAFGNPINGAAVTLALVGGGALGGTLTQATDAQGVATFGGLTPDRPGQKSLQAASAGLTANSQPFIVTANDVLAAQGVNVAAIKRVVFTGPVATFTDTVTTSPASDFTVTVDWGDGTPVTLGTVTGDTGQFTASGTHAYATEGTYTVTTTITDTQPGGPNLKPTSTATVKDITAPTTTAALNPAAPNGQAGFYTSPVTVTLSATDPDNAPSELTTFYRIDSGPEQAYSGPFAVSGDFEHLVTFYSKDAAGNAEYPAKSVTFKIDSKPPVTAGAVQDTLGGQKVTLTATDDLSGMAGTSYALDGAAPQPYGGPFTVSAAGAHTVTFFSVDKAGNVEADKTLTFTVTPVTPPPATLHTFSAGLQMFSVPEDYTGISNDAALSTPGVKLAVWRPTLIQYVLSPTPPADALHLGQGYWVRFRQDAALLDLGRRADATQPFSISLSKGWNMIGDPFFTAVPLNDVSVLAGGKSYDLGTANNNGLVYATLYAFPAGGTNYQAVSVAGGALAPYTGYWIYAFTDCALSVSPTPVSR